MEGGDCRLEEKGAMSGELCADAHDAALSLRYTLVNGKCRITAVVRKSTNISGATGRQDDRSDKLRRRSPRVNTLLVLLSVVLQQTIGVKRLIIVVLLFLIVVMSYAVILQLFVIIMSNFGTFNIKHKNIKDDLYVLRRAFVVSV